MLLGGSDIRKLAAANMRNLFITKYIYAQNTGCALNPGQLHVQPTAAHPELLISADDFFSDTSPVPQGSVLYRPTGRENDIHTYSSESLREGAHYSDHQFRDLDKLAASSALSRNPLPSFAQLLTDQSMIATLVDLPVGSYQLQLYGNNDTPGPVRLLIHLNDTLLGTMTFDRDDESWEIKCLITHPLYWSESDKNRTQISVTFLDDGGPGGSRDGYVAWIRLIPLSTF